MTPDRFKQIRSLFEAALEQEPARRLAFVDQASSSDAELRDEVRRMLEARDRSPEFLERPPAITETEDGGSRSRMFVPGTNVANRFEIVDLLSTGGMGEVTGNVWLATLPQD